MSPPDPLESISDGLGALLDDPKGVDLDFHNWKGTVLGQIQDYRESHPFVPAQATPAEGCYFATRLAPVLASIERALDQVGPEERDLETFLLGLEESVHDLLIWEIDQTDDRDSIATARS